jgi:hypothetical protein
LADRTGGIFTAGTVGRQYIWRDQLGDAAGNGLYTEPTDPNVTLLQLDIEEFRFAYDANNLYFYTRMHSDQGFFGAMGARIGIYLDRSDVGGGSATTSIGNHIGFQQTPRVDFGSAFEFDYHLSNRGGFESAYLYRVTGDESFFPGPVVEAEVLANRVVEMSVPWSEVGGFPALPITLRLIVGSGSPDFGNWRAVTDTAGEFIFGGGCPNTDINARFIDLIGAPNVAEQHTDLFSPDCDGASFPTISSSIITLRLDDEEVLLIELESFSASAPGVGQPATIQWSTSSEIDNVGFHVRRVRFQDGVPSPAGQVNAALIPAEGTASEGASYSLVDPLPVGPGERRGYVLVDIDANGTATRHGPIPVQVGGQPSGEPSWSLY